MRKVSRESVDLEENGLGVIAQINNHHFPRHLLHRTAHEFTEARGVELDHLRPLRLAHALNDNLLCRLRSDAPKASGSISSS